MQSAVEAERVQLERINFALTKAAKMARYVAADRIVQERKNKDQGGETWSR